MKFLKALHFIFTIILLVICCALVLIIMGGMGALAIYGGAWVLYFYIWLEAHCLVLAVIFLLLIFSFLLHLAFKI